MYQVGSLFENLPRKNLLLFSEKFDILPIVTYS